MYKTLNPRPLIDAANLCLTYKNQSGNVMSIIDDISVQLEYGEVIAIIGPSGSGKSCLLRLLAGVELPSSGEVSYNFGNDLDWPAVPIVLQTPALLPWRTVRENIQLGLEIGNRSSSGDDAVTDIIHSVGLNGFEEFLPKALSGGMKARVSIARALIGNAPVVLFDEAFTELDECTRRRLTTLFSTQVEQRKMSAVIVSHNIDEAVFLADRLFILTPRPAKIDSVINIGLPRPRCDAIWQSRTFTDLVANVRNRIEKLWSLSA